jgi:hypothetical protein
VDVLKRVQQPQKAASESARGKTSLARGLVQSPSYQCGEADEKENVPKSAFLQEEGGGR